MIQSATKLKRKTLPGSRARTAVSVPALGERCVALPRKDRAASAGLYVKIALW